MPSAEDVAQGSYAEVTRHNSMQSSGANNMYQASGAGSNDFRRHNSSQSSSQLPVDPEQGKPPTMRTGRSNNPQTGRIG